MGWRFSHLLLKFPTTWSLFVPLSWAQTVSPLPSKSPEKKQAQFLVFTYVPKFQRTQVKFSPRLSHGAHCTLKAGIRLVSRYLTLQVFSQVAGCQPSLFASTHFLFSIETPCSLGFWRVDGKYLSADLGLRCWLGGAEVVLS